MGVAGFWFFHKVTDEEFPAVQAEFEKAAEGVPPVPVIPEPDAAAVGEEEVREWLDDALDRIGTGGWGLCQESFEEVAASIWADESLLEKESYVEVAVLDRVLPATVLLVGIGSERFSQLPGHRGNMLIRAADVKDTLLSVEKILDVPWEQYFERTKWLINCPPSDAAEDVASVLKVIPNALRKVQNEGASLLALTSCDAPVKKSE